MTKNRRLYRKGNTRNTKSTIDGRKFAKYDQVVIRRRAIKLYSDLDFHPEVIAKHLGLSVRSVYRWIQWFERRGWDAFQLPNPARNSKLKECQLNEIILMILTKTPLDFGFQTALWTRAIICHIIIEKFNVSLHESTIGKILKKNKITLQKPIRKSFQQDKDEVKKFCTETFYNLVEKAKKENAIIVFLDESTITSEPNVGRTWGARGHTPIIPANGSKEKVNVIGTIDQYGQTDFMMYEGNTDSNVLIAYIDQLARVKKEKIYLILDNASYHKSNALIDHIYQYHRGWLDLVYLPPYSPELNPCELLWAHLKSHEINRIVTKTKDEFILAVEKHLQKLTREKTLCLSFFGKKELAYLKEALGSKSDEQKKYCQAAA